MNSLGNSPLDMRPQLTAREDAGRTPGQRIAAWAFSVTVQLMVLGAMLWPQAAAPPPRAETPLTMVKVAELSKPEPPGPPLPSLQKHVAPPPVTAPTVVIAAVPRIDNSDLLSASQIAGAANADDEGSGGGGGGDCNTARRLQQALRRDPLVRTAVEDAHRLGQAVMLWNGDWVRSGAQDGKGLSAVREAITWELAFSPAACRNKQMHGLVMLALADGRTRFAVGSGDWRWSDLLGIR